MVEMRREKMSTVVKSVLAIDNLEDLRKVQNALAIRFKELQARAAHSFSVGQRVSFTTKNGQKITGHVLKINQKTVSVKTMTSEWKVSGSLLRSA
jgi:ribosomal protein L35AE/L33A